MANVPSAFALGRDEGERLEFGDATILIRVSSEASGGAFTLFEEVPPLVDTPLHVHEWEDELFHVLEGEHVFQVGEEELPTGPGGMVFAPRGIPHAQRRVVPGEGRLLVLTDARRASRASSGSSPRPSGRGRWGPTPTRSRPIGTASPGSAERRERLLAAGLSTSSQRLVRTASALSQRSLRRWLQPTRRTHGMFITIRNSALALGALVALGLGGAAIAGATDGGSSTSTSTSTSENRPARARDQPLASDVAAKVKAAALAKVPGATVLRTEAGGPYGSAYHAHIRTSAGALQVVLVNSNFEATAVQAERSRGRGHSGKGGRGGAGETALTGDTKARVEAAVLAKYPGATIVRTETNNDSTAPYESHITTSAGQELEVLVSASFALVEFREHAGRP